MCFYKLFMGTRVSEDFQFRYPVFPEITKNVQPYDIEYKYSNWTIYVTFEVCVITWCLGSIGLGPTST